MPRTANKKIILGISGGIAAYKTPLLVRLMKKAGWEVQVILSPSAHRFVTAETLATVSERPVLTEFFRNNLGEWNNHVELGLWADYMLIAPATASTISKMAHGNSDNLLLTTYLSARCQVAVAPAMDLDMYKHPSFNRNLEILRSDGVKVIPAANGALASGLTGEGRMPEPEELMLFLQNQFSTYGRLKGKKVLVSAGPTYENIDPVRFIGNYSSGKMGYAIAEAFRNEGCDVSLVSGPVSLSEPEGIDCIRVQTALQMRDACLKAASLADIVVMAAAVADYRPSVTENDKIKKTGDTLSIELIKNPDILSEIGHNKKNGQIIVGFALETSNEMEHAREKLKKKNLDIVVMNSLRDEKAGFGYETNKVTLISASGKTASLGLKSKSEVASDLVDAIIELSGLQ